MGRYYHFAVLRWVVWAFVAGVLMGASALTNVALRDPNDSSQLVLALVMGAMFWTLFAVACWASNAVEWRSHYPHAALQAPEKPHAGWEEAARAEAIRARAAAETGESHPVM